jgi:hypothetical protein
MLACSDLVTPRQPSWKIDAAAKIRNGKPLSTHHNHCCLTHFFAYYLRSAFSLFLRPDYQIKPQYM